MARLNDTRTAPPGGWRYVQPETGCEMTALSFPDLVWKVSEHRRYKKLDRGDSESIILDLERQLCSGLEPRFCRAEPGEDYKPTVDVPGGLTIAKVAAGSLAMLTFVKGMGALVDKAESKKRADVCRGCRFNRHADGCGACSALYGMLEGIIPAARVEQGLKSCALCGCLLKLKVLMPAVVIEASNDAQDITYPPHCWQNHLHA